MLKNLFCFSRDESDMDDKPQINDDLAKTIGQVCVGNLQFFIRAI
jgi:hypothetical protein